MNRINKLFVDDTASSLHKKYEWRIVIRLETQTDSSLSRSVIWQSIKTTTFTAECLRTRMSPISSYPSSRLFPKGTDLRYIIYTYTYTHTCTHIIRTRARARACVWGGDTYLRYYFTAWKLIPLLLITTHGLVSGLRNFEAVIEWTLQYCSQLIVKQK